MWLLECNGQKYLYKTLENAFNDMNVPKWTKHTEKSLFVGYTQVHQHLCTIQWLEVEDADV